MRTHIDFNLRSFIQLLHPDLLVRYLERFQDEYAEQEGRESALVASVLSTASEEGFSAANIKTLVDMTRRPGPLTRLFEGPLRCVNDLNSPRGRACVQRELCEDVVSIDPELDPINAGMRLLLDYPDRMRRLLAIYQVEQTEDWIMFRSAEAAQPDVTDATAGAIAADFSEALKSQGLSGRCEATFYAQSERVIVEIAHEQYTEALREFRGGEIEVDWRKPVRHARIVYRPSTGLLKVKVFRNSSGLIELLRGSMGAHLFGWHGQFRHPDAEATFDLSSLSERPQWTTDPIDQIEDVQVIALSFVSAGGSGATAQFSANNTDDLYRMLGTSSMSLPGVNILYAGLRFKFPGRGRTGQRTVYLRGQNSSNLGDDDYDRIIEKYLARWGLLNAPEPPETDLDPDRRAREAARRMAESRSLFSGIA